MEQKNYNYTKVKTYSPFKSCFCYLDASPYKADQIFINAKLRVDFQETLKKGGFVVVFVKIKKSGVPIFEECMGKLDNALVIQYGKEYLDVKKSLQEFFIEGWESSFSVS